MNLTSRHRVRDTLRTLALAALGAALLAPLTAAAQTSSGQQGSTGGGFGGLGASRSGSQGLGLNAGPVGSTSSFGSLAPSGTGLGGQKSMGAPSQPGASNAPPSVTGRPAKNTSQNIGQALSAGPYAESRPSGIYSSKKKTKTLADKVKQASATAAAGIPHQWNYSYGSEGLGTNASSIYKSSWKSPTDDYQWGATTH